MNLKLRQLRAFLAIADTGSFTEAAHRLHLTQSALSVMVRDLESEFGVRLFDRDSRGVQMSAAGEDLYPFVQRALNELNDAEISVGNLRDKKKGILRIAGTQMMACTLLPSLISAYRQAHPEVEVEFSDILVGNVVAPLLTGSVELSLGAEIASDSQVRQHQLFRARHLLVCKRDHPLAKKKKVRWEEVKGYPFIGHAPGFMQSLITELEAHAKAGSRFESLQLVSFMTTAIGMVHAGLGITACPSFAEPVVEGYKLTMVPLVEPVFYRNVVIYSSARKSLSPAAEAFVQFARCNLHASPDERRVSAAP